MSSSQDIAEVSALYLDLPCLGSLVAKPLGRPDNVSETCDADDEKHLTM
jgi:hypothetical protein